MSRNPYFAWFCFSWFFLFSAAFAQEPIPGPRSPTPDSRLPAPDADDYRAVVASPDRLTEDALRAAFLGDDQRLQRLAWECEIYERYHPRAEKSLKENVAALAAARMRPLPQARDVGKLLEDRGTDAELDAMTRLVERTEPRDRLRAARNSRQYEDWRRRVNSTTNAISSILTLQFFPLLELPLDAIDYWLNGRRYLSPEQRRELYYARLLAGAEGLPDAAKSRARETIRDWTQRRRATAILQARRNGLVALQGGRLETADWWFRREMLLLDAKEPIRSEHRALLDTLRIRQVQRAQVLTVAAGEKLTPGNPSYEASAAALRATILDPASPETIALLRDLRVRFPGTTIARDSRVLEAACERAAGHDEVARLDLAQVANGGSGAWTARAKIYATRADFDPQRAFDAAHDAVAARTWRYVFFGEEPRMQEAQLTGEDARLIESAWIQAARSYFFIDVLGRALALPFLPDTMFPRNEVFDAQLAAPREFLATPAGREETRRTAWAYRTQKRYEDAERLYNALGDEARAEKMRGKSADALLKQAKSEPGPPERVRVLERIENAYAETKAAAQARQLDDAARARMEVLATITPKEMLAWPELWRGDALHLSGEFIDGSLANGEIDGSGLDLLAGDRIAWTDRSSGRRRELKADDGAVHRVMAELYPRRRAQAVGIELDKPRERKRIPVQIEGGAFPGFGAAPGLVPLDIDPAKRRLYE